MRWPLENIPTPNVTPVKNSVKRGDNRLPGYVISPLLLSEITFCILHWLFYVLVCFCCRGGVRGRIRTFGIRMPITTCVYPSLRVLFDYQRNLMLIDGSVVSKPYDLA